MYFLPSLQAVLGAAVSRGNVISDVNAAISCNQVSSRRQKRNATQQRSYRHNQLRAQAK